MDNLKLDTVFARNCSVRRISRPESAAFLDANHRMGDTSARYRYGLFIERTTSASEVSLPKGTLVAVSTFSNPRRWVKPDHIVRSCEWVRYASLKGVRVVGGMGKLLRTFIDEVAPDDVMTYADASWSDGDAYRALGFELESTIEKPEFKCLKFRLKV